MVKVLVKKLDPNVKLPSYKTEGSSGMDLMANINETIIIPPKTSKLIPTGLSVAIPNDCEIQIRPRSGLAAKSNISVLNTPGTIDSDYRGELKIILYNHGDNDFKVNNNDRIAQMVLVPILKINFIQKYSKQVMLQGNGLPLGKIRLLNC